MTVDSDALDDFLGEEVVDANGSAIGTLACYWEQDDGTPILIGIDFEDIPDTHVAPVRDVTLNTRKSYVVLPFSKDRIRRAPSLECGADLDRAFEQKVFDHYGESSVDYELEPQRASPKKVSAERAEKKFKP